MKTIRKTRSDVGQVMVGTPFGRLTVIGRSFMVIVGKQGLRKPAVVLECQCGKVVSALLHDLKRGGTKSCGCLRQEVSAANGKKGFIHGASRATEGRKDLLYAVWCAMRRRCHDPKCKAFPQYGAKGIAVCEEWRQSFVPFRDWALANGYAIGLTIDRIKSKKDYCPGNCQWITRLENSQKVWTDMNADRQELLDKIESLEKTVVIQNALLAALASLG